DEQAVLQARAPHLHPVGQHEGPLELPRGDAAMQEFAFGLVGLPAAYGELVLLERHVELVAGKTCDRERDPQEAARLAGADALDIVGRIAVAGGAGSALEQALNAVESEQIGTVQRGYARHPAKSS